MSIPRMPTRPEPPVPRGHRRIPAPPRAPGEPVRTAGRPTEVASDWVLRRNDPPVHSAPWTSELRARPMDGGATRARAAVSFSGPFSAPGWARRAGVGCYPSGPGRVAQRESARLTRERSQVQYLPRPRFVPRSPRFAPGSVTSPDERWRGNGVSATNEIAPTEARTGVAARAIGLTKTYGERDATVRALDDVSVEFERARFSAIMGPSGAGKSTLLHCMAGLDAPTSGQVLIGDVDLTTLSEKDLTLLRRKSVGFVFQAYNLVPTLTASENITLPLDIAGEEPDKAWFDEVVDTVGIRDRLSHRPAELSGGQQQR